MGRKFLLLRTPMFWRLPLLILLTWAPTVFAPPDFRVVVREVMTDTQVAQFAAYLRELKPNHEFDSIDADATEVELMEIGHEQEQEFQSGAIRLAQLMQFILPRNILKLSEKYPEETIFFIMAAEEYQPPMSRQLNALIAACTDREVRRVAASSLISTLDEDPHLRETVFHHLLDADPNVRAGLSLSLSLKVQPPLTAPELATLLEFRRLAQESGNPGLLDQTKHLLPRPICPKVHDEFGRDAENSQN